MEQSIKISEKIITLGSIQRKSLEKSRAYLVMIINSNITGIYKITPIVQLSAIGVFYL